MNKAAVWLCLVFLAAFSGCGGGPEGKGGEGHGGEGAKAEHEKAEEAPIVSRREAISSLPCFGCHSAGAFFNAAVPAGVFSHQKHAGFDVHCNQCHSVSGHMGVEINSAVCGGCHSLKAIVYEGGGMGKVAYNHEKHAGMFQCSECHATAFPMKKGVRRMKMDDMYAGKACGMCHNGKKAFNVMECALCHKQ